MIGGRTSGITYGSISSKKDVSISLSYEELLTHRDTAEPVAQFIKGDRKARRKVIRTAL